MPTLSTDSVQVQLSWQQQAQYHDMDSCGTDVCKYAHPVKTINPFGNCTPCTGSGKRACGPALCTTSGGGSSMLVQFSSAKAVGHIPPQITRHQTKQTTFMHAPNNAMGPGCHDCAPTHGVSTPHITSISSCHPIKQPVLHVRHSLLFTFVAAPLLSPLFP